MTALYDTASDLTAIRDVDTILAAIVRRARQLLGADMAYLSLNDEADGASYMKVTDGAFQPLGDGSDGCSATTGGKPAQGLDLQLALRRWRLRGGSKPH